MMKVKKYLSTAVIGISIMALPFVGCEKDKDENSAAYDAGKASGEKYCACLDTVSDPVWGAFECALFISADALLYTSGTDTVDFANGFAAGSASCGQ